MRSFNLYSYAQNYSVLKQLLIPSSPRRYHLTPMTEAVVRKTRFKRLDMSSGMVLNVRMIKTTWTEAGEQRVWRATLLRCFVVVGLHPLGDLTGLSYQQTSKSRMHPENCPQTTVSIMVATYPKEAHALASSTCAQDTRYFTPHPVQAVTNIG